MFLKTASREFFYTISVSTIVQYPSKFLLFLTGLLSAVVNLRTASSDASSITISWTAPYSLNVTGVDPDIWYSVLIYNVTDDEPTLISCTDCINITDTHYTFTPSRPCHQYLFTVIPFNGAGQGEISQNITVDGESVMSHMCSVTVYEM